MDSISNQIKRYIDARVWAVAHEFRLPFCLKELRDHALRGIEEATQEAPRQRRQLVKLLVNSISVGKREEDGRTEIRITYRFVGGIEGRTRGLSHEHLALHIDDPCTHASRFERTLSAPGQVLVYVRGAYFPRFLFEEFSAPFCVEGVIAQRQEVRHL